MEVIRRSTFQLPAFTVAAVAAWGEMHSGILGCPASTQAASAAHSGALGADLAVCRPSTELDPAFTVGMFSARTQIKHYRCFAIIVRGEKAFVCCQRRDSSKNMQMKAMSLIWSSVQVVAALMLKEIMHLCTSALLVPKTLGRRAQRWKEQRL